MPQVAQQDYIKVVPKEGRNITADAAAMAQIVGLMNRGTIMDAEMIVSWFGTGYYKAKCIAYGKNEIAYFDSPDLGEVRLVDVDFTEKQYEGLSAIQLAEDAFFGETQGAMPELGLADDEYLSDAYSGTLICVDDYKLIATINSGNLAALSISDQKPAPGGDFVNITWEDAQKLIGLPIS